MRFEQIRIQIIEPCAAHCAWCVTHRKNPLFRDLVRTGGSHDVHSLYADIVRSYRPRKLYVSGGEPLLSADLLPFLREVSHIPDQINVFTSYQFSRRTMQSIVESTFPKNVVLNHTAIYFEPERWLKLTGFPFAVYSDNISCAVEMPVRKRFKFIINHSRLEQELELFQRLIDPDDSCEITLKLMNDQGNGHVVPTLKRTVERVRSRLVDEPVDDGGGAWKVARGVPDWVAKVVESGNVAHCPYRRNEPKELRIAFYRAKGGRYVVKYRYCPYFPADFGHRFHIGEDDLRKFGRNFEKGPFREACGRCRLFHYQRPESSQDRVVSSST